MIIYLDLSKYKNLIINNSVYDYIYIYNNKFNDEEEKNCISLLLIEEGELENQHL